VTTGPVTVPILLAMGLGISRTFRARRAEAAKAAEEARNMAAVAAGEGATAPAQEEHAGKRKHHRKHRHHSEGIDLSQLDGFGVVTLASLLPILAVEVLAIVLAGANTEEHVREAVAVHVRNKGASTSVLDREPILADFAAAAQSVLPLAAALALLVVFMARTGLPALTFTVGAVVSENRTNEAIASTGAGAVVMGAIGNALTVAGGGSTEDASDASQSAAPSPAPTPRHDDSPADEEAAGTSSEAADCGRGGGASGARSRTASDAVRPRSASGVDVRASPAATFSTMEDASTLANRKGWGVDGEEAEGSGARDDQREEGIPARAQSRSVESLDRVLSGHEDVVRDNTIDKAVVVADAAATDDRLERLEVSAVSVGSKSEPATPLPSAEEERAAQFQRWMVLVLGVLETLAGFTLFNIGLSNGFTPLGRQAGGLLPAAYLQVPHVEDSPRYPVGGGVFLVLFIIFVLGFVATRAEPALAVLGKTVEKATNGAFSASFLLYSVCVGVGVGMSVGTIKILFEVGVIYFLIGKYSVVLLLTAFTNDALSSVAWDSAGVTTGPVTVPFVLSIGIGAGRAVHAAEGFGILTTASVTPILTVLVAIMVQRFFHYRKALAADRQAEKAEMEEKARAQADAGADAGVGAGADAGAAGTAGAVEGPNKMAAIEVA
jgi:Protein of unknown function (DUF1538)